jgi:hypothetical protein
MYTMPKIKVPKPIEFEWDSHNQEKNWVKHEVDYKECEEAFRNMPQAIYEDLKHSQLEPRYTLFSQTNSQRLIVVTYTIRKNKVRVISSRDQNKKERSEYEKEK